MPRRKVPRRKTARRPKRRMAKRKRSTRATTQIIRQPTGLPDRLFVKLRYADTFNFTTTSGSAAIQVFRGNSIFDPDQTGTGHQPYLHDQWGALYGRYRVHGSKISVRALPQTVTGANTYSVWTAVVPQLTTSAPTTIFPLEELPYATTRYQNLYSSTTKQNTITKYMSTKKIFGISKMAESADAYAAAVGANPTNNWYWLIACGIANFSDTETTILSMHLTYYVEFYQRANLGSS